MKQLSILIFFVISFGLQVAHAEFMNMGGSEIAILVLVGLFTVAFVVGLIFLSLHLIKRFNNSSK